MKIFSKFCFLTFITTYLGIFFLRGFHYGFIYEDPAGIILDCIPTVVISTFLIIIVVLVEKPIIQRFEKVIEKGINDKSSLTDSDIKSCWKSYKKYDLAIAIGDAIGFLLGAGSTAIVYAATGKAPFSLAIFLIIEFQSVGVGFLCYTINVFLIKRIFMTQSMRKIGIKVRDNLNANLNIAIATCIYITMMNTMTAPINILLHPREGAFTTFIIYFFIGSTLNGAVCFGVYTLLIRRIQRTEKNISTNLLAETATLAAATKESAKTSINQSSAVKEIVATMHDSSELASNIGNKVREVNSLAEKSRDAVLSGNESLQNNVKELLDIRNTNTLTIEGIKELNKKISGIWDIVSIINNVADQTKIIAFNAELEASSSGEAGKNFHIVATEIRRLSDNIIDSIKEIKSIIDEIQKAADTLILDSEKGTRQIDAGCNSARSLETGFESIMDSSKATADSSKEIMEYVGQLISSSEQIFITLQQIAQGIENFSTNTANISSASENVKEIASLL